MECQVKSYFNCIHSFFPVLNYFMINEMMAYYKNVITDHFPYNKIHPFVFSFRYACCKSGMTN